MNHSSASPIDNSSFVTLNYRISLIREPLADEVIVDTFLDKPATLQLGMGQWSEALEDLLIGLEEGQSASFQLPPDAAYGPRNPELIQSLSQDLVQSHSDPKNPLVPGDIVEFPAPHGGKYSGVLKEINESAYLFDFNHPLAGHSLKLDVQIIGVL